MPAGKLWKLGGLVEERNYFGLLLFFSAVLFFPFLGARNFWAPVEPRYAEIARVMLSKGEWITPTVNGDLYTDKPILYFWLVLLFSKLAGGVNEWTVRLPSALSAMGLVLTVYGLGRDFFRPRAGFLAGLICGTSARVLWEGRWAHTDMLFAFFFTLSLYFLARAILKENRARDFFFAYALMALATLTKGLIGIVLPGLIVIAFVALRREWRRLLEWRLVTGAALFLLIAAPWFSFVTAATGGQWLKEFILFHHFQRYAGEVGHREPFYYYLVNFPADFLPWTIFAIPALYNQRKKLACFRRPIPLFFLLWFAVIFVFFNLSHSKRALYLLPAFPPAALFVAQYFEQLRDNDLPQDALYRWPAYGFFSVLGLAGLLLPAATWFFQKDLIAISLPTSLFMAGGAWLTLLSIRRQLPFLALFSTALTVLLTMVYTAGWILPAIDLYKSPRPFALQVKKLVPTEEPLFIYADTMNDFNFYLERETVPVLSSPEQLERAISQTHKVYLLIRDRDLVRLALKMKPRILAAAQVGGKKWSLTAWEPEDGTRRGP